MRINVYSEELTDEVEVVEKTADTGVTFYGLRIFLKSAPELHNDVDDDDRSAITFWVPATKDGTVLKRDSALASLLDNLNGALAGLS